LVERVDGGGEVRYLLTDAGRELRPVVEAIGSWGTRWIGALGDPDLDPKLLLWDMHRNVDHARVPAGRTVVQFDFVDLPGRARCWWLLITPDEAEVCDLDPGYPVSVTVQASLRALVEVWRGDRSWAEALRHGTVDLLGPTELRRALPRWFTLSPFAGVPRARGRGGLGPTALPTPG
ncbi:MAG TPA: winged helix-turn-helix transcriptional regulator, partial [Jatrophihabitans sp.]|nr:winged helix-turn-helix transcriptional regulator [Jatrophihabitans sp.]